jgi:hypothetical protein
MATEQDRIKALSKIYEKHGDVKPSIVLQSAKPKSSPIHDEFEWDTEKAALQYNLSQARRLIRVTPIKIDGTGALHTLVHVPAISIEGPTAAINDREGSYKPIAKVVKSEPEYVRALRQLQTQMHALERSINELKRAHGHDVSLLPTLVDAMQVAKDTLKLMIEQSSSAA